MSPRFASLFRHKHALEKQDQIHNRKEYLDRLAAAQRQLRRRERRQELDSAVITVLEDFRQAAYPRMKIRTYEPGWSLGNWKKQPDGSLGWEKTVDVLLRYDGNDHPNGFECSGHNHVFKIPINLDTLAATLLHIYLPHSHPRDQKR